MLPSWWLAEDFAAIHAGTEPPTSWGIGYISWLWKGKKSKLNWRSYRGIVLASTVGKAFERVLHARLALWVAATGQISHLQAVANGPLDGRHQVQLLHDLLRRRKTEGKDSVVAFVDIGGAYPRTSRDILWWTRCGARVPGGECCGRYSGFFGATR